MNEDTVELPTYDFEADQVIEFQTTYSVKYSGTYSCFDMVEVYKTDDEDKVPLAAFPALYIATGKLSLEDPVENGENNIV
jgi:hypothetical protein